MKVLVCGKGGSGKSTLTALLAKNLHAKGWQVLVVDADESNFGLSPQLGIPAPTELMEYIGGKRAVQSKMGKVQGDGHKAPVFSDFWTFGDIPKQAISGGEGVFLVQVGKVKHYGEGCACPMGVLAKDFLNHLKLNAGDIAIVDTEAGVEHLGRGLAGAADLIFAVIDPSYESIRLSEKIADMAKESQKPLRFVLNRVEGDFADKITAKVGKDSIVAELPFSKTIQEKGLMGEPLDIDVPSVEAIATLVLNAKEEKQA